MRPAHRTAKLHRCLPSVFVCLAWLPAAAAGTGQRLEYQFVTGDRLVYERRAVISSLSDQQALHHVVDQIQIWCLETDGDTARLLLDLIRITDGQAAPMRGLVLQVDRRGQRTMLPVSQARALDMWPALEVLPVQRSPTQGEASWKTPPDLFACCRRCRRVASDGSANTPVRVDYEVAYPASVADVLGRTHAGHYWFDPAVGIVTRVESLEEDRVAGRRVRAVTILRQGQRKSVAWAGRRAAEAQRYLRALRREDGLLANVVDQPKTIEKTLERLQRLWAGAAADFDSQAHSPFAVLCRARQRRLKSQTGALRADADYAARWLGRQAVPWSLQDPAGHTLASEEARVSVVIECLWSTTAPGAFAVLEALSGTQKELAGSNVRILHLNLDQDAHLARRVIEHRPAELTHVLAGPLQSVEQPPRLPVVRVLDRDGIIRWLRIGWRPSYADAVAEAQRWAE